MHDSSTRSQAHRWARRLDSAIAVAAVGLGLLGCTQNDKPEAAADLFDRIAERSSWARAPGYPETSPSSSPHGDEVDIFINDVAAQALSEATEDLWPDGTIIAKDGYEDGTLVFTVVMEKQGDAWFWAEYDGEGETLYSGEPDVCVDCHASGRDFVLSFSGPSSNE